MKKRLRLVLVVLAGLAGRSLATAYTWDGGGADNTWTNDANWDPDGAPASSTNNDLTWIKAGGAQYACAIGITNDFKVHSLTFSTDVASPVTINPTILGAVTGKLVFAKNAAGEPSITQNSGQPVTINALVRPTSNLVFASTAAGTVTLTDIQNGTGTILTKNGTNTVAITTTPRYGLNGTMNVNDGRLVVATRFTGSGGALLGTVNIGDGIGGPGSAALEFASINFDNPTMTFNIQGDGLLDQNGYGLSTFEIFVMANGAQISTVRHDGSATGDVWIASMTVPGASTLAPVIYGQVKIGAGVCTWNIARGSDPSGIDMDVQARLDSSGSGAASFLKLGNGVLRLGRENFTGSNGYRGYYTVSGGTLLVNSNLCPYAQPAGSDVMVVSNTATLGGIGTLDLLDTVYHTYMRCRFDAGGTLAPGSLGVGTFTCAETGSVVHCEGTSANPSVFSFELASASSYDVLRNQGTLMLTGTNGAGRCRLNITRLGGYTPASTDKFFLVENYGNYPTVGTFANADTGGGLMDLGSNWVGKISYSGKKATGAVSGGNDIVLYAVAPRAGKGTTVFFR